MDGTHPQCAGVCGVPGGFELVGAESQSERGCLNKPRYLLPIIQCQTWNPSEFTRVVGYQFRIIRHCYRRNNRIIRANHLARGLQIRTNPCIVASGLLIEGETRKSFLQKGYSLLIGGFIGFAALDGTVKKFRQNHGANENRILLGGQDPKGAFDSGPFLKWSTNAFVSRRYFNSADSCLQVARLDPPQNLPAKSQR